MVKGNEMKKLLITALVVITMLTQAVPASSRVIDDPVFPVIVTSLWNVRYQTVNNGWVTVARNLSPQEATVAINDLFAGQDNNFLLLLRDGLAPRVNMVRVDVRIDKPSQ